jgi:hypothetical protein
LIGESDTELPADLIKLQGDAHRDDHPATKQRGMAKRFSRRRLLEIVAGLPFMSGLAPVASAAAQPKTRVRPGDPAWPSDAAWDQLSREVEGRLIKVQSPLAACVGGSSDVDCARVFKELKNPYYLGGEVGLTQSLGWVGPGRRARAPTPSPPRQRRMWSPRSISPGRTICG